jgi:hypothetical protein
LIYFGFYLKEIKNTITPEKPFIVYHSYPARVKRPEVQDQDNKQITYSWSGCSVKNRSKKP